MWDKIYKDLEDISKKMDFFINAIVEIECSAVGRQAKNNRLAWLPDFDKISLESFAKEVISIYDRKTIGRLHIGIGYNGPCLAYRTYCMDRGIKHNISEWILINIKELN